MQTAHTHTKTKNNKMKQAKKCINHSLYVYIFLKKKTNLTKYKLEYKQPKKQNQD